jgi:hypothetical protein
MPGGLKGGRPVVALGAALGALAASATPNPPPDGSILRVHSIETPSILLRPPLQNVLRLQFG